VSELDYEDVDRLLREGETRVVERKRDIPRDVLGPAVSSLANTLGGWLLIGVTDDNPPHVTGFTPPGRAHLQDYIRDRLRGEVDPMPPFAAAEWTTPDGPIGIVRVYESTDTPHMVRRTGAVYVREQGGRIPASHEVVRELARRGDLARQYAEERLRAKPFFDPENVRGLALPFQPSAKEPKIYTLRATPLTVGPVFRDRALTERLQQLPGARHSPRASPSPRRIASRADSAFPA
jgi:Putative DNA-binding domain